MAGGIELTMAEPVTQHMHTPSPRGVFNRVYGQVAVCVVCEQAITRDHGGGSLWVLSGEDVTAFLQAHAPNTVGVAISDVGPANSRQVGGTHYKETAVSCPHCGHLLEHWDVFGMWDGLLYSATKYIWRWKQKDGVKGLLKAIHYLQKRIEVEEGSTGGKVPPQRIFKGTGEVQGHIVEHPGNDNGQL